MQNSDASPFRTLILLDVDGTLIHSMELEAICYSSAFVEHLGIDSISTDWENYLHATDPGVAIELYRRHTGREPSALELKSFRELFVAHLRKAIFEDGMRLSEVAGASGLLSGLATDFRFSVAIGTGGWRDPIQLKLAAAAVEITGLPFASADRLEIFSRASKRAGGPFARTVLVGDGTWDVETAKKLGFAFVGIGIDDKASRLRSKGASHVIRDFSNYELVVDALQSASVPNI